MGKKGMTPGRANRCFGILLAILLAIAAFLYWQNYIQEIGFLIVVIALLVAGIWCTLNTRIAQRDGFLDGYVRAKDDFDKEKRS